LEDTAGLPGRGPGFGRDWTKGNIFHNLLRLSWPMAVSNTLMMLGPTIDMIWVGKLGQVAIAAITAAGSAVMLIMTAMMGLMMGMRAMVARFVGAGDIRGANHVAQQTVVISVAFSVGMAVVGIFFANQFLDLFGLDAEVVAVAAPYMRIMFIGAAAMAFRMMAEGVLQASGDTVNPMWVAIVYRLFHVALCPFLIFGQEMFPWWMFPGMGVSGAAATNVVSQSLATIILLWMLFTGRSRLRLSLRNFRLDLNIIWRIIRIGLPAVVSGMQRSISYLILLIFMARYATVAVAAHGIAQRVEMILFMPAMAFGMGSGVLVGQNLGAGQPERAERSAWLAVGLVQAIVVACCAAILLWPEGIVRIFNTDPGLVETASTFLRIAVAGYALLGLMAVFMQALSGAGDTMPTMIIGMLTVWLVTLPIAYFLSTKTDLGVYGVRWGMAAGMIFAALIYTVYFRLGRWKRKKV